MSPPKPSPDAAGVEDDGSTVARGLLPGDVSWFRATALVAVLVLTASYVSVLWDVARVVGGSGLIVPVAVAMVAAATLLSGYIGEKLAALVGVGLLVVGYAYYLAVTPVGLGLLIDQADALLVDAFALLTGLPILRMIRADVWALAYVPAPVFVSWYLVMRRRYVASVAVGGVALAVLVLTSDAGATTTLAGVLAGVAAVGFGELDRRDGTLLQADSLVVLVTLIVLTSLGASVVAGSGTNPITTSSEGIGGGSTVEGTLVGSPDRTQIVGSISLSPEVRFTVEADEGRYWRTGVYDRYTGDGWVRTRGERQYEGSIAEPPGPRRQVVQTYTAESRAATMPAAAEPVRVVGDAADDTLVTEQGPIRIESTFLEGDQYRVYSSVPAATPSMLRSADTEYPDGLEERYTRLPDDTPDRLAERTATVTESADNPYDAALLVERHLEDTKEYSLEVERPDGQVADTFLFEMDAGYCTYFATTMVAMLRSQGIPARMAVGYTPGQQVDDDEWVVRGLNSHAWVEVYFPEYGWIRFDPTPGGPRQSAELDAVRNAREGGGGGSVDTDRSEDAPLTTTTTAATTTNASPELPVGEGNQTLPPPQIDGERELNGTTPPTGNGTNGSGEDGGEGSGLPSTGESVLGLVVLAGAAAGAHRVGWTDRLYDTARLRWHGRGLSPTADAERAFERLEILLSRQYRPRRPGETPRQYLDALSPMGVDPRTRTVVETYERAAYAGSVDREAADEAVEIVDDLVAESRPLRRWLRK